jgi:hypothetical protein
MYRKAIYLHLIVFQTAQYRDIGLYVRKSIPVYIWRADNYFRFVGVP